MQTLNNNGITVCLENYYRYEDRDSLVTNITTYNLLINQAAAQKLDFYPLIDIPRIFIHSFEQFNSLFICELILNNISFVKKNIILHLIDFNDNRQRREDWCPVSTGKMEYAVLFDIMGRYSLNVEYAVLEYEVSDLAKKSLTPLTDLLAMIY
jgi:hypothetical protein